MQTRREQVQAHRFLTRRIVSAMLSGEPDTNDLPMRRLAQAVFASVMIGTIVLAVVGVVGVVTGRGSGLEPNTLVIESGTGATFVYLDDGGDPRLYPVLNYASARLILAVADPAERTMSAAALRGLPRGPALGIPNAPDSLPRPDALIGLPWSVCNLPGETAAALPSSRAVLGQELVGGATLTGDEALLVATRDADTGDTNYLVTRDRRLKIANDRSITTLSLNATPLRVTKQFINALPSGPDLGVFSIEGANNRDNRASFDVGGGDVHIGAVYQDENRQYYVATRDGLVRVGDVYGRLRLALNNKDTAQAKPPLSISTTEAAKHLLVGVRLEPAGYPINIPVLRNDPDAAPLALCTSNRTSPNGDDEVHVSYFRTLPATLQPSAANLTAVRQGGSVVSTVNQVIIAGGAGALVRGRPAPGSDARGSTLYLVTDDGVKYPLAPANATRSVDAVTALGYAGVTPITVPVNVLDLLPTGVTLDGNNARRPVPLPASKPTPTKATAGQTTPTTSRTTSRPPATTRATSSASASAAP
jgi:type VII secretion protein EccB